MLKKIKEFKRKNQNKVFFDENLGGDLYLNTINHSAVIIGNSSSGIIESATTKTKVINVGNRQKGRIMPRNVINSKYNVADIKKILL